MKYVIVIDTEFIDTPTCSALISLALLREDGAGCYFEFNYPENELTPWLCENVVPHLLVSTMVTFAEAKRQIVEFIGDDLPEFWCYHGAYDWYWFCRVFGGVMEMNTKWPMRFREFADVQVGVPDTAGAGHNALNDCRSILNAMKKRGLA